MKNATFSFTAALCAALALAFTACNNDDPAPAAPPLQAVTFRNLAADPIVSSGTGQPPAATGRFTLFSFGTGQIVPNADSASTQWDIGFRATRIIFNGGGSGPGQAAV
nr:HmuY family protein [Cytophagales bacterium]